MNNTLLKNNYIYLYIIIFSLLIFLIIKYRTNYENFNNLTWAPYKESQSNTNNKPLSVEKLNDKYPICSKKCCSTQWKVNLDSDIIDNTLIEKENKAISDSNLFAESLPSNLNCNNGVNDTGCVCFNQLDNKTNSIKKSINVLKLIDQNINSDNSIKDNIDGYMSDKFYNYSNY